ncbi:Mpv17-like protein [Clonorchis sinensis]|uniref:Mitochondrial inner membrane protein Mpv17 n=2 Tax=Clonorchis sinensis TaxID=79923 RepID=A0A8T1MTF9_CLOSI|nr:Mpv17-like protein [Clonorchis sinensis]
MRNPLIVAWRSYVYLLKRKPLIAHSLSTGILMTSADALSQKMVEKNKRLDFYRNKNFLLVGTFYLGPCLSVWYRFIAKFFTGHPTVKVAKLVCADQLIFTPPLLFGVLSLLTLLRHRSVDMWKRQISENYGNVLLMNYKIWPFAQVVNFVFIPLPFRVLFINTIAVFWNIYVAYTTQRSVAISTAGEQAF